MNSSSPANMLPNNRIASDTGLASSSTEVEQDVGDPQQRALAERRGEPLVRIAADTLGLDRRSTTTSTSTTTRHRDGAVEVGGGQDAPVRVLVADERRRCSPAGPRGSRSMRVHRDDPREQRQRQRREEAPVAVVHLADVLVDELEHQLDESEELRLPARGGLARGQREHEHDDGAHDGRHHQRVDVESPEALAHLQVAEMVRDVVCR